MEKFSLSVAVESFGEGNGVQGGREDERALNIRAFTPSQKRAAYEKQGGICEKCQKPFPFEKMEGDHIVPWSKGGKTVPDNLQMLCRRCNAMKSDK